MSNTSGVAPSIKKLEAFFDYIWGDAPTCSVGLAVKSQSGAWGKAFFNWPEKKPEIIEYVKAQVGKQYDVWFHPAVFRRGSRSSDKINVLGASVIWADFDGNAPDEWDLPSIPVPSVRVRTSAESNQHAYWKLDVFVDDLIRLESLNKYFTFVANADKTGWDANQLLRVPGTRNFKRGDEGQPVTIFHDNASAIYAENSIVVDRTQINDAYDIEIDTTSIPSVIDLVAKYDLLPDTRDLLNKIVPDGQRAKAMLRLAYECAELGMQPEEMYSMLLHVDDKWGKYKTRADRKRRLISIISRAKSKVPKANDPLEVGGLLKETTEVNVKTLYTMSELMAADLKFDWKVTDLITSDGLAFIIADPGVGKSQMALRLCLSCATGRDWLGYKVAEPHKVLYLSLEMGAVSVKRILTPMLAGYTPLQRSMIDANFLIDPSNEPMDIEHPDTQKYIVNLIKEHRIQGIYIDSVGKIINGEISKELPIRAMNLILNKIRSKLDVYFVLIHHSRKSAPGSKNSTLSDTYGNVYLTVDASLVINLWRAPDTKAIEFRTVKNRFAEEQYPFHVIRTSNLDFIRREIPRARDAEN